MPQLRQREAQVVMCLRQIRIGHHRMPELLERPFAIVLAPIEQSEACVGLRVVRFQLERFLIGRQGSCRVLFALPRYAQIIMAGRQLGTLLDRKSTRLNSSHGYISYAVFCLKKKKKNNEYIKVSSSISDITCVTE